MKLSAQSIADIVAAVQTMRANNVPDVDGLYMVQTRQPCVDYSLVHPPRTHEQRKAARRVAAQGNFCGFVSAEV